MTKPADANNFWTAMTSFQRKNNWDKGHSDTHSIYSGASQSRSRSANRSNNGGESFGLWGKKNTGNIKNRGSSPVFGSSMG
jgi:hypothetical protein